jgi:hypothetical protein
VRAMTIAAAVVLCVLVVVMIAIWRGTKPNV